MMNEFGLLFNVIKKMGDGIQEKIVGEVMKVFETRTVYEKVAEGYRGLPGLFPDGRLDKRLESYIVSFVDQKSLKSMILVSKSWFLRAYLLQYISLRCGEEGKLLKVWLWQAFFVEGIGSKREDFRKIRKCMELARELSLPGCKISLEIVNNDELGRTIVYLEENPEIYEEVVKLDCKFLDINGKNYKKVEGLFKKLPNLVELEMGKVVVGDNVINLSHDKLESLVIYTLSSKEEMKLEMGRLRFLKIGEVMGVGDVEADVEFRMACLEECWINKMVGVLGTFGFDKVRKCGIELVEDSTIVIGAPRMEEFKLGKIVQCVVTLKDFPKEVIEKMDSIVLWRHGSLIEVVKSGN